ncbi:MAG: TolC family protein [Tannerella sp.]|jgi:outer membrane protein TolC|nr:TolC family protein [Tannerella sp.]
MKIKFILYILPFFSIYISGQEVLTLEQCRRLAIENNKDLKIATAKIQMAEQERKAARTKFFPQLSATGTYIRNQKNLELIDYNELSLSSSLLPALAPVLQTMPELAQALQTTEEKIKKATHLDFRNIWLGDLSFVQPIFMGGKIIVHNQIANYAEELAKSMNNMQFFEVIYRTDEVYWQIVSLENKKNLADKYVEMLKKTDNDITAMINEGVATRVDGLSVKVKLNEAEMAQTKVNNGLALSHMLLAQICGLELASSIKLADEDTEQISTSEQAVFPDINVAFSNRQELRSLELMTKIYKKKENIVVAEMLPNVAFTANYIVMNPNSFYGYKNEFAGMYNFGVAVKIPLSGWWEGTHMKNSARAETLIKTLELENAREKIELQVHQSAYKVNEAGKQLNVSKRNMEKAEENLRFADLGFKEGVIPALNLMEAQTAWFAARSQLIDAQIELKLAKVYFDKALGKSGIEE